MYPAKFAFGITEKDCVDDFVVFTTSAEGADSSGTFLTQTGTFSGVPAAGETITITNKLYAPDQVLTLTAHASENIGLNFAVGTNASQAATNLANAIARNGGTVGVTATASGATVTIASITTDVAGNEFDTNETLSNFTLAGKSRGKRNEGPADDLRVESAIRGHRGERRVPDAHASGPRDVLVVQHIWDDLRGSDIHPGFRAKRHDPVRPALGGVFGARDTISASGAPCDTIATRGIVRGFRATTSRPPANTTVTFTVMKNGAPTSITCSYTNSFPAPIRLIRRSSPTAMSSRSGSSEPGPVRAYGTRT